MTTKVQKHTDDMPISGVTDPKTGQEYVDTAFLEVKALKEQGIDPVMICRQRDPSDEWVCTRPNVDGNHNGMHIAGCIDYIAAAW